MSLPGSWTITKMVAFWIVMRKPRLQKFFLVQYHGAADDRSPFLRSNPFTMHWAFIFLVRPSTSWLSSLKQNPNHQHYLKTAVLFFRVVAEYQVPLCMYTHIWKQDDRNGHPCLKPRWPEWAPKPCLSRLWSLSMEVWLHLHSGPGEKCTVLKGNNPLCLIYRNWT